MELTAKSIYVAGTRTRYYDIGQGEPTILIHGGRERHGDDFGIGARHLRSG